MNPYQIAAITLRLCRIELTHPFHYSSGETDPDLFSIVVETSLRGGAPSGWGEWLPTSIIYEPGHIGRSGIDEWEKAQEAAAALVGTDARERNLWIAGEWLREDANSLVDGFDFALADAVGRQAGWSVQQLLGGGRPAVWGMPVVPLDTPDATARHCAALFAEGGYRWFKLKPSCDRERDLETLVKIQEGIPAKLGFYIDPNYQLSGEVDAVVDYLNTLHPAGLAVCEDPIRPGLDLYREISGRTAVKLMVDEKARTIEQVLAVGKAEAAGMINIHANWAGGFRGGLRRAELAAAFGMGSIIGSVRYLGFGSAAYQTLSSLMPYDSPCEQAADATYIRRLAVRSLNEVRDGRVILSREPGFGTTPDHEALEALTLKRLCFQ
ncbi:MAG TPA: mandelate racemase/muconate lactonizing enzyme family protein [Chthoniobacteraceae bacterium]|nr:mandelate racemase/muconate lactonizing enzyme family protein [Chthoniobacteraceae bacterium]